MQPSAKQPAVTASVGCARAYSLELDVEHSFDVRHLLVEVARLLERAVGFERALALRVLELHGKVVANLVYQDDSLLVEPLDSLSVFPQPVFYLALRVVDVRAQAVLFAFVPPALVFTPVCPVVYAEAFFFVHKVLPVVAHSVRVYVDAKALHIVGLPLAVVLAAVFPEVDAISVDFIVEPLAFICGSVSPGVLASALFLAHDVLSLVLGTLWPSLYSIAMLLVFLPVAFVPGALHVRVDAETIGFIIHPLAVVDVPISVEELALTASLVVLPIAFVPCSVDPDHISVSMAQAALPLSGVHGARAIRVHSVLEPRVILVGTAQRLLSLIAFEVLALHFACQLHDAVLAALQEPTNQ